MGTDNDEATNAMIASLLAQDQGAYQDDIVEEAGQDDSEDEDYGGAKKRKRQPRRGKSEKFYVKNFIWLQTFSASECPPPPLDLRSCLLGTQILLHAGGGAGGGRGGRRKSAPAPETAAASKANLKEGQEGSDQEADAYTASGRRKRKDAGQQGARGASRGWSDEEEKLFMEVHSMQFADVHTLPMSSPDAAVFHFCLA